jgi:ubiquinone/menaquinone biosynthesis C-methylase UbiE
MSDPHYYDRAAREYARLRKFSPRAAVILRRSLHDLPEGPLLDIGCGTGNFTRLLLRLFPGRQTVGLDFSRHMLEQVEGQRPALHLLRADACSLPHPTGVFALTAGAYFIHHISDWQRVLAEAFRVLQPGGFFALYTSPEYRIRKHMINRFFPSFRRIDLERFPPEAQLIKTLAACGFEKTRLLPVSVGHRRIDRGLLGRTRRRFMSTFDLVPEAEFRTGLEKMESHVGRGAHPRRYRHMGIVLLSRKPAGSP